MEAELARRRGTQVAHSLNVIAELPRYVDDTNVPTGLRVAAIDAFFVHLRLLIEFLIKPRDAHAIRRHDYARDFHLDPALRTRLSEDYELASRRVAHFNIERVPTEDAPTFEPVDGARLRTHAADVFGAMRAFVEHLRMSGSAFTEDFDGWLSLAEGRRQDVARHEACQP